MDINSLLSPSETPKSVSSTPNSPTPSPFKFVQRTHSGPLINFKHAPGVSPLSQSVMTQSNIPAHLLGSTQQSISSPLINPVPASSNALNRSSSTQSIETLADLAAMQNHQPMKSAPMHLKSREYDPQKSPSILNPALAATLTSNPRASFDINMMEGPKHHARIDFTETSLPTAQQERLGQLAAYVQETPSAYESHAEIIKILHQGFIDHIYPPSESSTRRDPHTYDLLRELTRAREDMEKLFAVGEQLWIDWLQDESILARTAEERIAVVERCRKAVEEEVGSVQLWIIYGEWVRHCYEWAHNQGQETPDTNPDEERMVGRELFTWQLVIDTWQEAADQTALNISQSHLVWDKYLAIQIPNAQQKLSRDEASRCLELFEQRLLVPHATWDDTFQMFSSFVSANLEPEHYEQIMSEMLRAASDAKKKWSARETFEAAIEQAQSDQDRDREYLAFTQYLRWEETPEKRRKTNVELTNALFQRAELRFPSDTELWEEHVTFLLHQPKIAILPLLERATKHCPWSGSLWSQYLLSSDRAGQAFHETESIKHKATRTGLLEAAGTEDVIKVHAAWCSYLRRRSSRPDGSEEELDVAEMGIRSSIENVASLGAKLGLSNVSDPAFRLHRIHINFLSESGRWDNARQEFDNSVAEYGNSWEFWMFFYHWEMGRWRRFASNQQETSDEPLANVAPPHLATAVLKKALDQGSLDYPEPIMQALITHCEDYEDADELQAAILKVQKAQKALSARRQIESAMAAETVNIQQPTAIEQDTGLLHGSKRKRDNEEDNTSEDGNKKVKNEDEPHASVEKVDSSHPKRDRENATILVENLPETVSDTQIRQYFSNCGVVRALKVIRDDGISAIVEFDDDDAAKYALSRDGQEFEGAILSVILDTGSTIYLTNYKPAADDSYINDLLGKYGEIVSIRFPSLQGNKKRRFCYVQFKLPSEAQAAASELDEQQIDGFTLTCKISNPAQRQARKENNVNDGRTIFIGQLNFKATEAELEKTFSKYGLFEKIRMPLHPTMKNRNKGIAYITYQSLSDAAKAASEMDGKSFKDRNLTVEIATSKAGGRRHESSARSATPAQNGSTIEDPRSDPTTRHARQIFLTNVPDTVNEARIHSIAEPYGKIVRVILKTNHQGAIVEYSDATEAGQASLKLDGHEIESGRHLSVVTEAQMHAGTREKKLDGFTGAKEKPKPKAAVPIGIMAPVRRPQQSGVRKGGNLGQRSTALHKKGSPKAEGDQLVDGEAEKPKKSNDDFRALFNKTDK